MFVLQEEDLTFTHSLHWILLWLIRFNQLLLNWNVWHLINQHSDFKQRVMFCFTQRKQCFTIQTLWEHLCGRFNTFTSWQFLLLCATDRFRSVGFSAQNPTRAAANDYLFIDDYFFIPLFRNREMVQKKYSNVFISSVCLTNSPKTKIWFIIILFSISAQWMI